MFFPLEWHCVREPPAGQGASGRVQADHHGEGQPREHTQCQAGNYGHCRDLQRCRREGRWEKGFLPWPKTSSAFTHSVSDSNPIPEKDLGITRRGLQPHPQQRTGPVGSKASPKSFVESMQQQWMSWKVGQCWAGELDNHNDSRASFG